MQPDETAGSSSALLKIRAFLFPVLIVTSVLVIITPLPPLLMDFLLATNVTTGVIILLTTIYVARPLEFSVFPSLLLGTTLARLVLNVASTRLILTRGGTHGVDAAGGVIQTFGNFVAGNSIVVGLIMFIILIAVQFLVITKGATRISEVAARFALDGMPAKQMAIDADVAAEMITPEEARIRRAEVVAESDFYAAMDGASKFVRGDAIAGIVITLINIIGGLYIGMVEHSMGFGEAIRVFTTLTIGDGLVTQVPGFLISLAAALVVTRSTSASNLPEQVVTQMFRYGEALVLAALFLFCLVFTGMPFFPMMTLSLTTGAIGWQILKARRLQEKADAEREEAEEAVVDTRPIEERTPEESLQVDALELEMSKYLLQLVDPEAGGDLLSRVTQLRHAIAQELGMILPKVRMRDNTKLLPRHYQIKIRGVPVAWGEAYVDGLMAINTGAALGPIQGIDTIDPAFGRPAKWIDPSLEQRALDLQYGVFPPSLVITTHLIEVVRDHCAELLTRQQVHALLENLKKTASQIVEEVTPEPLRVAQVHQVLTNLLEERVPIRDLEVIMETLGDYCHRIQEPGLLTEYVRHGLARTICQHYRDSDRVLRCVTLDPGLEELLAAGMEFGEQGLNVKLDPEVINVVVAGLAEKLEKLVSLGYRPVVVCNLPQIRAGLKRITHNSLPKLAVLSFSEVTRDTQLESLGVVGALPQAATT